MIILTSNNTGMADQKFKLGMIGLGTMGRNLLLNMADHGFAVAGHDKDNEKIALLEKEGVGKPVKGYLQLSDFINSLETPKVVMLLVPAGKIVDSVIEELKPLLSKGDIIIDGGNSHFTDTTVRVKRLEEAGLHFFGMGVSGGEEGARKGPSMMPGGDTVAYQYVQPILEAIAAKVNGESCVAYIGPGASGHFVKMVHNGIEYALMQLIADTYEVFRKRLKLNDQQIGEVFAKWNKGKLNSYLLEITADIFAYQNTDGTYLVEQIKDEAKSKGTGKWTTQISTDLELPISTIDLAVAMRDLSKYKSLRLALDSSYNKDKAAIHQPETDDLLSKMEDAFYFSSIIIYAQGMHLLSKASEVYAYGLKLDEIARIWRGGCIIRASLLELIYQAYKTNPGTAHLLLDDEIRSIIKGTESAAREVVVSNLSTAISIPAYASALSYFDAICSGSLPSNLIQAQRDYFGAHTYELIGKEGVFHTEWIKEVD
jgi:6-phosphogluconate dehydrogenase